ncbi:hypothetical protein [Streptomyces sp. MBT84]|uniref:hypothetical protein n=1 Tax=Streptomyces sp. MBT84 TaxID=1488414 RepID=UPI001C6ED4F6|nr:hypothetical protein [Streptomyces sp. MBT84]
MGTAESWDFAHGDGPAHREHGTVSARGPAGDGVVTGFTVAPAVHGHRLNA